MDYRASILVVAALFATALRGDVSADGRWHARAVPWKAGLPSVEVTFGYPGGYVSSRNSPIEMRVTGAPTPFDGYIGFRFTVDRSRSREVPVLARAVIAAGGSWAFETYAQIRQTNWRETPADRSRREVLVQWYDASMRLVAQANVGRPPWDPVLRPLYIVGSSGVQSVAEYAGVAPLALTAQDLGKRPQWFTGFSAIAVGTSDWLDLPLPVRQAIFHSDTRIVTFGFPRNGQLFTDVDRAAIPVEFMAVPSVMEVPWMFGPKEQRAMPLAWHARDPRRASSMTSPYFVAEEGAQWVAEPSALRRALPVTYAAPLYWYLHSPGKPKPGDLAKELSSEFRGLVAVLVAVVAAVLIWLLFRNNRALIAAATTLVLAFALVGVRSTIRRNAKTTTMDIRSVSSPSVIRRSVTVRDYGRSPLQTVTMADDVTTWSGKLDDDVTEDGEIRTSETVPGHGLLLYKWSAWDSASRTRWRREIAKPTTTRIVTLDDARIVIDLDPQLAISHISARWAGNSRGLHYGERHVAPGSTRVSISSTDALPSLFSRPYGDYELDIDPGSREAGKAQVRLTSVQGSTITTTTIPLPAPSAAMFVPYRTGGARAEREAGGKYSAVFKLPRMQSPADAVLEVNVWTVSGKDFKPSAPTTEGCNGKIDLGEPRRHGVVGSWGIEVPYTTIRSLLCADDLLKVAVTTDKPEEAMGMSLTVRKKGTHE